MRNYCKMFGEQATIKSSGGAGFDQNCAAWAATKKDLAARMNTRIELAKQAIILSGRTVIGVQRLPVTCYWELDKSNLASLLDGPDGALAIGFWNNSGRLPLVWNPSLVPSGVGTLYKAMTELESPRKTWSNGH